MVGHSFRGVWERDNCKTSALIEPPWLQVVPVDSGVWAQSPLSAGREQHVGGEDVGLGRPGLHQQTMAGVPNSSIK